MGKKKKKKKKNHSKKKHSRAPPNFFFKKIEQMRMPRRHRQASRGWSVQDALLTIVFMGLFCIVSFYSFDVAVRPDLEDQPPHTAAFSLLPFASKPLSPPISAGTMTSPSSTTITSSSSSSPTNELGSHAAPGGVSTAGGIRSVAGDDGNDDSSKTVPSPFPTPAKTLTILPLGDAITRSPRAVPYRHFLYCKLRFAGVDVRFVGSKGDMPLSPSAKLSEGGRCKEREGGKKKKKKKKKKKH
jgi:hypothetical protein